MKIQRGVSLLELLISLSIFSIGLLGLLTMQTASLRSSYAALLFTQNQMQAINLTEQERVTSLNTTIAGFTLLEVLITLTLSLSLFIGIYEVFNSIKQSFNYTQALATLQQNGQLASYIFRQELLQTGYVGCRKIDHQFLPTTHTQTPLTSDVIVHGYRAKNLPLFAKNSAKIAVADSSILSIQFMTANTAYLSHALTAPSQSLTLNTTSLFKSGDEVMISDCVHADLVYLTQIQSHNRIETNAYVKDYPIGSQIGLWQNEWFYVGETGRFTTKKQPITALYLARSNGRDEELIDNVANMHIQYGYLTPLHLLHFVPSTQITNWSQVKAIRILLLLNSEGEVLSQKQRILFDNVPMLAADNRLYKEWEIIVGLLNR